MRKILRVVCIFICSMRHCFFDVEGIACFDAAQRRASGRVAAALTDRSKCDSGEDSACICGENNLTRLPTRNHSRGEGTGDIGQQNANYWQVDIMNVMLRKEVPEEILYNLNYTWSNRIWKIYRTITLPVVLYGCETWSLTLREERRLRVFENKVFRRIFGPRRDEVTGDCRRLHNEELND